LYVANDLRSLPFDGSDPVMAIGMRRVFLFRNGIVARQKRVSLSLFLKECWFKKGLALTFRG